MDGVPLNRKIQTALDETRLLLLGAQILLGFQLSGSFMELFNTLTPLQRYLHALALISMVAATAFLIAPTMRHRLVERGHGNMTLVHYAGFMAGIALLPFAVSLGIDHFNVFAHLFGITAGLVAGFVFFTAAAFAWYVLAVIVRPQRTSPMLREKQSGTTPLVDRVDHMLTEARVVLPGAQALLGFQLSVVLMRAFQNLPDEYKIAHAVALMLVAISVILLMAPAAVHRIGYGGEETEEFYQLGSNLVVAATVPLAAGITIDVYVAVARATNNGELGIVLAAMSFLLLVTLWYLLPLFLRARQAEAAE
jgi:hypothetical protein